MSEISKNIYPHAREEREHTMSKRGVKSFPKAYAVVIKFVLSKTVKRERSLFNEADAF